MSEDMKPHVAFLPSSGMGHIFPLFQLAKQLALHHGFRVSFIVITTEASASQNHFFQSSAALLPGLSIIDLPPADVSGIITDDMRLVTRLSVIVRESLKPVKSILLDLKPTSLIIDIFTTDAIDVCKELLIPVYSFFTASTVCLTFSLYLPTLDCEVEGEFVDLPAPVEIPGRLPLYSGIFLNAWEDLDPERLTALNENPFFKSITTPPVFPVGPLIKDGEILTVKDAEILAWLDAQPCGSVLYVSLGSGGTLSSEQLIELAWGLEMSRQRFILVVRRPTDLSAYATFFNVGTNENDPSAYLPERFLERTRGVGLVVPTWAPQSAVLAHPSTGAFLSHCGWNSTLESLVHGKPMIAWPLYAEQRMNATMLVEEVRVAVKLGREEVIGREEIERVVRAVMEGEQGNAVRLRARELKESAQRASESSVGRVLDTWKSKN
ncbi:UNVERIFIED_CONTAM: Anthocyanidin 3-O-glucosyltransferase 5 [Sesamum radiatum]|uniref:Glycosyltransferase n=1 Tax=Sesamum radiatum TaxID=300843 RepID=A0AAW2KPC1_SESRA